MSSRRNELVKAVFQEALDRPESGRTAFVNEACRDDERARDRVMVLLAAYAGADGFLSQAVRAPTPDNSRGGLHGAGHATAIVSSGRVGSRIGPYKLLQLIGEGGFGAVYMAEQEKPIRRRVALKLIKLGMDTKQVIARFEAERQALAMMEHPNIARVLDAGATESGRPYFVMELVKGIPITEYCDENRLSTAARLELFTAVCSAIQHAHQKGVVHRDIKPSNVLVTLHDGAPVPKVIDFGVARATDHRLTDLTLFTEYGQFIGTPTYMSPEQAGMSGMDVDTRSDIYSLGVLLYELLTGTTPYTAGQLRNVAHIEVLRVLRDVEPPRPSTRLSQLGDSMSAVARLRDSEPGTLEKLLRGDLDWIVMKALEKDRSRRYASASELAADIGRFFSGDPVSAGPPDAGYRVRKFVRRNRGKAGAAAAVFAAIVLGGSAATWQAVRAGEAATHARANAVLAYAAGTDDPLLKALLIDEIADGPDVPGRLGVLRDAANHPLPLHVFDAGELANNVEYSPNGEWVAAAFMDGTARVWRSDGTGEALIFEHGDEVDALKFSPQGDRIVTGTSDGFVRVWSLDGRDPVVLAADRRIETANFSPDGRWVSAGTEQGGPIWIWPADGSGDPVTIAVDGVRLHGGYFFRDGERILTGGSDGIARVWRIDGTGPIASLASQTDEFVYGKLSREGGRVAVSGPGHIDVYPADLSGPPVVLEHEGASRWIGSFSDRYLVTSDQDGTVMIWPLDQPDRPVTLQHAGNAWGIVARDGSRIITTSSEGRIRIWQPDGRLEREFAGPEGQGNGGIGSTRDVSQITADFLDGTLRTWSLHDAGEAIVLRHDQPVNAVAFSPDGRHIASAAADGTTRIWAADGAGGPIPFTGHHSPAEPSTYQPWARSPDGVASVRFSVDGTRLVTASRDGTVRVQNADGTGEPTVIETGVPVRDAAFSPDGSRIVAGGSDGRVLLFPSDGSGPPSVIAEHPRRVESVSFSPDGSRILSASETAHITQVATGREDRILRGSYFVADAEFSPDGEWVAIGSESGDVRIFPVDGDGPGIALRGEESHIWAVAFSPDSKRVVAGASDGTARIWDLGSAQAPLELAGHGGPVTGVAFSPDGTRVATSSVDGTVRIWRVSWPELLSYVRSRLETCLTPDQRVRYLAEPIDRAQDTAAACRRNLEER